MPHMARKTSLNQTPWHSLPLLSVVRSDHVSGHYATMERVIALGEIAVCAVENPPTVGSPGEPASDLPSPHDRPRQHRRPALTQPPTARLLPDVRPLGHAAAGRHDRRRPGSAAVAVHGALPMVRRGQRRSSIAHTLLAPTHRQLGLDLLQDRRSSVVEALAVTFGPCRPSGALRLYSRVSNAS